jgi:hypothetical protein
MSSEANRHRIAASPFAAVDLLGVGPAYDRGPDRSWLAGRQKWSQWSKVRHAIRMRPGLVN